MEEEQQLSSSESPFLPLTRSIEKLKAEIHQVIVGQDQMIDQLLVALLTNGHILLEGVPGIAKTLTAKLFAKTISVDFSRIQFTPDLMPTDVLGTSVFNLKDSEFTFKQGPIFSNLVLIDEINRAPAKTQAALFEVMEETQVTVDGKTYPMEFPFLVLATQNPIEQEGTYKLPEAQLDRFLFKVNLKYPSLDEEKTILKKFNEDFQLDANVEISPVLDATEIKKYQALVETVHIKEELLAYIANIVHNTRENGNVYLGASPRASLAIMKSAKAMAAINSRPYVIPEDIQNACYPVLNHRLILTAEKEMEGLEVEGVIKDIIHEIEVPR